MSIVRAVRCVFVDGPQHRIVAPWLMNVISQIGTCDVRYMGPQTFSREWLSYDASGDEVMTDVDPLIFVIETRMLFADPRMKYLVNYYLTRKSASNPRITAVYCSALDSTFLGREKLRNEMNPWTVGNRYKYDHIQLTDTEVTTLARNVLA